MLNYSLLLSQDYEIGERTMKLIKNKRLISVTCAITALLFTQFKAYANTKNFTFLKEITELHSKVNQHIQEQVRGLTGEFNNGLDKLSGEAHNQIEGKINQSINQTIESTGIFKLMKNKEQQAKQAINRIKTGVFEKNLEAQLRNFQQSSNQQATNEHIEMILGTEAEKKTQQENKQAQTAVDASTSNGEAAQNDHITQDIMKKIATQNTQTAELLHSIQNSMQEQNQMTAITNLNLADISQNLTVEQKQRQNQQQGDINGIYQRANFSVGFWNRDNNRDGNQ